MEDWEKKLYKKFVQSRVTNPRELKGDTIWESEQWLTGSPRELVVFIQDILEQELDRAREEGRKAERDRIFRGLDSIDCIKEALPKNYSALGMQFGIYRAKEIVLEKELSKLTTK